MLTQDQSDLIGSIYDAALDPERWTRVLAEICAFLPGCMGNIFSEDKSEDMVDRFYTWGEDPHFTQSYITTYARMNPLMPHGMFFPVGAVYSAADILPIPEMMATQFAREWLEPQGYVDFVASNLHRSATGMVAFTIVRHRDHGLADAEAKARMAALVPHVQRAIAISRAFEQQRIEAQGFGQVLDTLKAALFFLTPRQRLVHANRAGHALLAEGRVARLNHGRVDFGSGPAQAQVEAALAESAARGGGEPRSIPLGRDDGTEHGGTERVAIVLPLTNGARLSLGHAVGAASAVFIGTAPAAYDSPLALIAKRFRLTAGETRTLRALVDGATVKETADALGIEASTVRSHLHSLFAKTEQRRQADLVRLVTSFPQPLSS